MARLLLDALLEEGDHAVDHEAGQLDLLAGDGEQDLAEVAERAVEDHRQDLGVLLHVHQSGDGAHANKKCYLKFSSLHSVKVTIYNSSAPPDIKATTSTNLLFVCIISGLIGIIFN